MQCQSVAATTKINLILDILIDVIKYTIRGHLRAVAVMDICRGGMQRSHGITVGHG